MKITRFKLTALLSIGLLWFGVPVSRAATTYYVATNGTGGGTSWADATNNLQGAIDVIEAGAANTVWVSNGVYKVGGVTNYPAGSLRTNRVAIWKAITVRSANNNPTNTVIQGFWDSATNGPAAVACVWMTNGASLIGFTIAGGAMTGKVVNFAGGVSAPESRTAVVSNCVIASNAGYYGGGARNCILYNSILRDNVGYVGGGASSCTLQDCMVISNRTVNWGDAVLYPYPDGAGAYSSTLRNCTLIANSSVRLAGGASACILYSCLLANNSASSGAGAASYCTMTNCTITKNSSGVNFDCTLNNCIIYFNSSDNYGVNNISMTNCCTTPAQSGWHASNITNDPLFITNGSGYGATTYVLGNYHLQRGSPCINAGMNQSWMTLDLDGHSRIDRFSGIVDMGCYEYLPQGMIISVP